MRLIAIMVPDSLDEVIQLSTSAPPELRDRDRAIYIAGLLAGYCDQHDRQDVSKLLELLNTGTEN